MKIAIITVAGISSRFNRVSSYDKIIVVGGFKFDNLAAYMSENVSAELKEKISLCNNDHYDDLSSGYSLYLGVKEALSYDNVDEILFVEGDLDIDDESFSNVVKSQKNVITYNKEPIYSNKAVVLYQNENDDYKYLFNSDHGLLAIEEPFKAIFNSGQTWKFRDDEILERANTYFKNNIIEDTNLGIIQKYFDLVDNDEIEVIELNRWVNCNTRDDYKIIKEYWSK